MGSQAGAIGIFGNPKVRYLNVPVRAWTRDEDVLRYVSMCTTGSTGSVASYSNTFGLMSRWTKFF